MKYKVGDRVKIKSLDWYNENKDEYGRIEYETATFDVNMQIYCESITTIHAVDEIGYDLDIDWGQNVWTDEMIEGLVEEENKPKFKVGDEVRIKGTDIGGTIESVIRGQLIVNSKGSKIPAWPEDVVLMKSAEEETVLNKWTGLKVELELSKSVIGVSNVESLRGERFMSGFVKAIIPPEGYQFVDENGNIINATKIVLEKKKKEYPKTYCECKDILGLWDIDDTERGYYKTDLIDKLQMLLICRDAYWKIAGDEMGLGKPWEPDWKNSEEKRYCIVNIEGDINLPEKVLTKWILKVTNKILVFPTEEMRDAFYENFKELIEQCKELL